MRSQDKMIVYCIFIIALFLMSFLIKALVLPIAFLGFLFLSDL